MSADTKDAPAAGHVAEVTDYQYQADQIHPDRITASRSILQKIIQKSPAHAWAAHPRLNPLWEPDPPKKEFDVGTVCHQLLFDGAAGVQVLEFDNWRTNASKEAAATARAHGLIPLLDKEWEQADAMITAVRRKLGGDYFAPGQHEVTLVWEDHGVLCRARLDYLSNDRRVIRDFKTSSNAEPFKFSRGSFFDYGYDLQDAFYRRAVAACFDTEATFELIVAEKDAPYETIAFASDPATLALANAKLDWALGVWRECLETGVWPGYDARVHSVTLPPWIEDQWWRKFEGATA